MGEKPKFEECLRQVEQVIQKLETGKLGLEESLAQYEAGIAALRKCYEILGGVEKRVDLLMKDEKGNISAAPFDTTATTEKEEQERSKRRKRGRGESSPSDSEPAEQ